jgi:hypothetical protein
MKVSGGLCKRCFIPRTALNTPFEVKDVVPAESALSIDDLSAAINTHLRMRLSKQKQDIIEALEQTTEAVEQRSESGLKSK